MAPEDRVGAGAIFQLEGALVSENEYTLTARKGFIFIFFLEFRPANIVSNAKELEGTRNWLILMSHQIFTYDSWDPSQFYLQCDTWKRCSKTSFWFGLQGIDTEEKEKGSQGDATKLFGANTPTVSCSFDSEGNKVKVSVAKGKKEQI